MAKPKLTYFDFHGGRGEPARLALSMGGIPFEDDRLASSDWQWRKRLDDAIWRKCVSCLPCDKTSRGSSYEARLPFLQGRSKGRVRLGAQSMTFIGQLQEASNSSARAWST